MTIPTGMIASSSSATRSRVSTPVRAHKSAHNKRKDQIDTLLLKVITSDLQPSCSLVENKSFRSLVKALNPLYELPNRDQLSEKFLPKTYEAVQQEVRLSLQHAGRVAVTTESWISWSSQQYMTVTAHIFSSSWEKKSFVLSTTQISNDMTAAEIAVKLKNIFIQWEIHEKVNAVVTDSSSLMADAVRNLEIQHVPCFVHIVDRAVKEGLKSIDGLPAIANRVRGLVSYFQNSNDGMNMLKEIQGDDVPLKMLVKDEEARWMSTVHMFRCYIEQHEKISTALCLLTKTDDCITESEVGVLKKVVETLEPFELAAKEMCVEKYTTLSTMIPMLKQLQECLAELPYQDFPLTTVLSTHLCRLSLSLETNFTVDASTVLDPRFKYLPFNDYEKAQNIERHLTSMLSEMFQSTTEDVVPPVVQEQRSGQQAKSLWNRFDSKVDNLLKSSSPAATGPAIELRRYFESRQPRVHEVHPFEWWKSNEALFPNLARIAQHFLAIPATSVPANLIFSKASEIFLAKRSCLNEGHVDKMIFLNKNHAKFGESG
ncbi:zinc finger BED domain-containing protein 1 [Aplysia californica]|uniref:Zinc finger BED domain-containing protein 1 n=1 Tax=Aplysia californica TaxID=6500 RepID=A0ABM0JJN3_APLCA|nr:zinc finger BED domain-containing protein 1 [Aplysia californica]